MTGPHAYADPRAAWVAEYMDARDADDDERIENALAELFPEPEFASDGRRVAIWLAENVVQTKGRFSRIPLVVEDWQYDFICELYRLGEDGRRVYQEATLLLPRKNGKSTLASGLGLYHLCADYEQSPEVYVAAGSKDQAGAIFRQARDTVNASPALHDYLKPYQAHIACPDNAGILRVLASDFRLQHGTNPSANFIDEKWAHKSNDLATALTSGTGARDEPMTATISTVGHEIDSPLGEDVLRDLENCELETRDDGYLLIGRDFDAGSLLWYYGPPFSVEEALAGRGFHYLVDLDDPETWERCNPASWIDPAELRRQYRRLRLSDFRRFRLNAWTEAEDLWLPEGAWMRLADEDVALRRGRPTWVAVDMGRKKDSAAIVVLQATGEFVEVEGDEPGQPAEQLPTYDVDAFILEPEEGKPVDHADVRAVIREVCREFDVEEVIYDPWRFDESAQMLGDSLDVEMVEFPQSNERMAPASQRLWDAIIAGRLRHAGDRTLASHVNAGVTVDVGERGWRLTKRKATARVDALIALCFGLDQADRSESHSSVYDDRDMTILD